MISLLKFDLRRIFTNKMFVLLNIMIFLGCFMLFHMDRLNQIEEANVYVDSSTKDYQQYFNQIETDIHYELSDEEHNIIIHLKDDRWIIHSKEELSSDIKEKIQRDIKNVIIEDYKQKHLFMYEYILEMNKEIQFQYEAERETDIELTIISTISFFLILNFSSSLANTTIYEKGTRFINILFIYLDEKKYIFAKVLESFIVPAIHFLSMLSMIIINFIIRYLEDGFAGLAQLLNPIEENQPALEINIRIADILMIAVIMISTLVLIQLLIMFIVSRFTSSNQSALFISLVYICLLLAYFLLLSFGKYINYSSIVFQIFSYLPLLSMLFLPLRIVKGFGSIGLFLLSLVIIYSTIWILIKCFIAEYKENMLNN